MGLPAFAEDYLFLGPLIVERLKDQVPDMPIGLVERAEQVLEADRRAYVLMVLWAGDRVAEGAGGRAGGGTNQQIVQRWLVSYAVNNVARAADSRLQGAGVVLSRVHKALAGWTPSMAGRPLVRANAPLQPVFTESKAVYPLGFEITLNL